MRRTLLIAGVLLLILLFLAPTAVSGSSSDLAREALMIASIRVVDGFVAVLVLLVIAGWIAAWFDDRRHAREVEMHKTDDSGHARQEETHKTKVRGAA